MPTAQSQGFQPFSASFLTKALPLTSNQHSSSFLHARRRCMRRRKDRLHCPHLEPQNKYWYEDRGTPATENFPQELAPARIQWICQMFQTIGIFLLDRRKFPGVLNQSMRHFVRCHVRGWRTFRIISWSSEKTAYIPFTFRHKQRTLAFLYHLPPLHFVPSVEDILYSNQNHDGHSYEVSKPLTTVMVLVQFFDVCSAVAPCSGTSSWQRFCLCYLHRQISHALITGRIYITDNNWLKCYVFYLQEW